MRRIACFVVVLFALTLCFIGGVKAATMTLEFTNIWLDHHDRLYIDDAAHTLQWYYFGAYTAVGIHGPYSFLNQAEMHVKITNNGSLLMDQDWTIWTTSPSGATYSSTLSIPDLPFESIFMPSYTITLTGRDSKTYDFSDPSTKWIELYDPDSGPSWYTATVEITYTPQSTVPEPCTIMLLGAGMAGIVAFRKRLRG